MAVSKKKSKQDFVDHDSASTKYLKNRDSYEYLGQKWLLQSPPDSTNTYNLWMYAVTLLALAVRFYKLSYPREVVFDEVHFGKFASYYLERTYFFDVHPPFAKLLIASIGWLVGYNGAFKFDDIGDSYDTNPAPFIAYRSLSAILGTLTVPIMFNTLKEMNFKAVTCALASILVAVDNAHVTETRLILLDATLIISIALSLYTYVRFYKAQLKSPFSSEWYFWLYATGLSLSFVISTKYVGVFTFFTVGIAVVSNLWQLLDVRAGLTLKQFFKHFVQRLNGLVFFPFIIYLFWFWVHFTILNKSGPGDSFMSPEFQETLGDSPLAREAKQINYFDIVTFKHKNTEAFLHSHLANYPLRYEDGRVSSQGQQVTGYSHDDLNNQWEIIPTNGIPAEFGHPVNVDDVVRLRHVVTNTYLLAHDVASPLYPTNEEITTVPEEIANGDSFQETLFRLQPVNKKESGGILKTKASLLRIVHVDTTVALWTHNDVFLPDWGFGQQEINGNKKITDSENTWFVDTIVNLNDERKLYVPKPVKKLPFFTKWSELQKSMFVHNNKLSSEHPFASQPESWPGSLSGVSFWTEDSERKQIYFIGNIIGWWFQMISLAIFVGIVIADMLTRQRSVFALSKMAREKLYAPLMFLFIGWCCHYFPFFLMARQKFLHHYLPAHLIASLFSAAIWEMIFTDNKSLDITKDEEDPANAHESTPKIYIFYMFVSFAVLAIAVMWFFFYFSPLVYGDRSLTPAEVVDRQWLNIELHFAK